MLITIFVDYDDDFSPMEIRAASEEDIPRIVELLKISLGESLMPKSHEYWRWKHMDNPFGKSPVLLCWQDSTLIGVRAFMRWNWIKGGLVYRALRAVDTATHPEHQGKGIFKKLTLSLVNNCIGLGDHFVFNTPNSQSRPGYLKMGWEDAGRLPVVVSIQRPFSIAINFFRETELSRHDNSQLKYYLDHPGLSSLVQGHSLSTNAIITNTTISYLKWRYLSVPVTQYVAIGDENGSELNSLVIARIKKTRFGNELRITDCFFGAYSDQTNLTRQLQEHKKRWKIDYTTMSGLSGRDRFAGSMLKLMIGPAVTVRSLKLTDLGSLKGFRDWSPSIGDLELF